MSKCSIAAIRAFSIAILVALAGTAFSIAQDPDPEPAVPEQKPAAAGGDQQARLPKYDEMELPTAEVLLRSKPFDWLVLKSLDVVVVEPVPDRPETLTKMNLEYERYLKGRAGFIAGTERLKERRRQFQSLSISLVEPGIDQDPDYMIETKMIQKIDYFEDLVLQRINRLIDEKNIPIAYDLLMLVDRRHRENNVRLKNAYESQRLEELEAANSNEQERYTLPELPPLKLNKSWPHFDETHQRLIFVDAGLRASRHDFDGALQLLEDLWDRNSTYPELSRFFGQVIDMILNELVEQQEYRRARFYLARLTARDSQHPMVLKWKSELIARTTARIEEARQATASGDAGQGARLVDQAARIWPETPGLREAHRELTDRHQIVSLGVFRLAGEPTGYPFPQASEELTANLTRLPLFEPVRVDERGVRYRSSILEAWEPLDLGRKVQFTVRVKRADWEARPVITAVDVSGELSRKIDPNSVDYDERLAGSIENIRVESPTTFSVHFRRLPLRLEALLQFPVSLENPLAWNPELPAGALAQAGRQRFYEFQRDDRTVSYRRVRTQPASIKTRHVEEVVQVRYESWEQALQGLIRGEIAGIPHVELRDLKALQDDNRFFVVQYALPVSHQIMFNPTSSFLRDGQLRRAISLGIPRHDLLENSILAGVSGRHARLTATPFPTISYAHNRILTEPPYDPQRAAALVMTAKKQLGTAELPVLRLTCPPDPQIRASLSLMIEQWQRIGLTVKFVDDRVPLTENDWDLAYRTTRMVEPLTDLWPLLTLNAETGVEALRPLADRIRRQLLDLERANDWTSATKLLHRIAAELLIETRFVPLWEVDDFFVIRRHLTGLPARLMQPFQDVERWTLQSWYPQETP